MPGKHRAEELTPRHSAPNNVILVDVSRNAVARDDGRAVIAAVHQILKEGGDAYVIARETTKDPLLVAEPQSSQDGIDRNIKNIPKGGKRGLMAPSIRKGLNRIMHPMNEDSGINLIVVTDGDVLDKEQTAADLQAVLEHPKSKVNWIITNPKAERPEFMNEGERSSVQFVDATDYEQVKTALEEASGHNKWQKLAKTSKQRQPNERG